MTRTKLAALLLSPLFDVARNAPALLWKLVPPSEAKAWPGCWQLRDWGIPAKDVCWKTFSRYEAVREETD